MVMLAITQCQLIAEIQQMRDAASCGLVEDDVDAWQCVQAVPWPE